jgi:hypothetical protein
MQIGVHKRDVREASLKRPRASDSEDAGVCINANHVSGGTDELGRDHRHCSDTTADIQHFHAWLEPGLLEQPAGAIGVHLRLPDEPLGFGFGGYCAASVLVFGHRLRPTAGCGGPWQGERHQQRASGKRAGCAGSELHAGRLLQ